MQIANIVQEKLVIITNNILENRKLYALNLNLSQKLQILISFFFDWQKLGTSIMRNSFNKNKLIR